MLIPLCVAIKTCLFGIANAIHGFQGLYFMVYGYGGHTNFDISSS